MTTHITQSADSRRNVRFLSLSRTRSQICTPKGFRTHIRATISFDKDQTTKQNAERNHVSADQYQVELPDQVPATLADIMVANILAGPLMSLAETLAQLTKAGGQLALSGILAEQAEEVRQAYEPWFIIKDIEQQEDWVILKGERRSD